MAPKTGNYITGGTDMSQEVYEANRPYYSSVYASLDRAKQLAASQVKQAYSEQIGSTYLQGQQSQAAIGSSALGANYKQYLQTQLQQNINQAYNTYLTQQSQALTQATSAYDTAMSNLTSGITEAGQELGEYRDRYATASIMYGGEMLTQSDYFKLRNYADYKTYKTENPDSTLTEEEFYKQKRTAELDYMKFEGMHDEYGNVNWDAVQTALYAKRNEAGEVVTDEYGNAIFDQSGELSTQGKDIFDYLMRYDQRGFENYQNWLYKNDKDLWEWSIQRSILGDPTNAYSAMKTLGADGVYNFVERFGGLTEKQTEKVFGDFKVDIKELSDNKGNLQAIQNMIGDIKNFYQDLGLTSVEITIDGETGTIGTLLDKLANAKNEKSLNDIYEDFQTTINEYNKNSKEVTYQTTGIAATGAAAAGLSLLIPGLGVFLAPIIGGVTVVTGASGGAVAKYYEEQEKNAIKNQREALENAWEAFALQSAAIAKEMRGQITNK